MASKNKWWGDIPFSVEQIKQWGLGERKISVQRLEKEWIVWDQTSEIEQNKAIVLKSLKSNASLKDINFSRHLVTHTMPNIIVEPKLADRSVVARPSARLNILPNEHAELYVSSPLWFGLINPDNHLPIIDMPFFRPSDSWFGTNTMQGELCYAKNTDARVNLTLLEKYSHRAITKVIIHNEHTDPLKIDRINLPVPFLSLYHTEEAGFWTQEIEITQHNDSKKTGLKLRPEHPDSMQNSQNLVSKARQISDSHHFVKSIKDLLN
ncbi:hypothetical protein [Paraglaciecola aestuariivivens]